MAWSEIWEQLLATPNLSALIPGLLPAGLDLFVLVPASSFHQSGSAPSLDSLSLQGTWGDQLNLLLSFLEEMKSANPVRLGAQAGCNRSRGAGSRPVRWTPSRCCPEVQGWDPHPTCERWPQGGTLGARKPQVPAAPPGPDPSRSNYWDHPSCGNQRRGKSGGNASGNVAGEQTPSRWENVTAD